MLSKIPTGMAMFASITAGLGEKSGFAVLLALLSF
jgi:hypothetical protein